MLGLTIKSPILFKERSMKIKLEEFKNKVPQHTIEIGNEVSNDYPVHYGYNYLIDNYVVNSDIEGTISQLKMAEGFSLDSVAKTVYIF